MLPDVFPASRILGFGWDIGSRSVESPPNFESTASEIISKLTDLRKGYLQRAIIFIGHGYGTVLIANILAGEGQLTQERANLMSSTAAVVLFAAPLFDYTGLIEWTSKASKIPRGSKFFSSPIPPQLWENLSSYTKKEKIFTFAFLERDAACPHVDEQEDVRTTKLAERLKQLEILDTVETKENIANVAKFAGPEDQRWELIRSRIYNVVRTHQLLDVARDTGTERLERLIKNSFDLNLSNRDGQTALQMAAKHQRPGAVKLLLGTGKVNINHQDISGMTALHIAVACNASNSVEIVHDLLSSAANSDLRNNDEKTAKDLAAENVNIIPQILVELAAPPLVRGPGVPERMTRGTPPEGDGTNACRKTGFVSREVFGASETAPDTHLPVYSNILNFIYGNETVDEIFKAQQGERDLGKPICRWHHIPMNNMAWVNDLFGKLGYQMWPWPGRYRDSEMPYSVRSIPAVPENRSKFRCMPPQIAKLRRLDRALGNGGQECWAIMMPYISYEEIHSQQRVTALVAHECQAMREARDGRNYRRRHEYGVVYESEPEDGETKDGQDKAGLTAVIKAYLTLDQSYYYMLKNTKQRDRDQVVSRWVLGSSRSQSERREAKKAHNILMVDQLWIWVIKAQKFGGTDTVITSFPRRKGAHSFEADDIATNILNNKDRDSIYTTVDLVCRTISMCCQTLSRHQNNESIQFLQCFESSIGNAEDRETQLFKRFRKTAKKLYALNPVNRKYQTRRSWHLKVLLDISAESKLLKEVKDILDELKMIDAVLSDQQKVLDLNASTTREFVGLDFQDMNSWKQMTKVVSEIQESFNNMREHARSIEVGLEHLLDLKQKQANLWEARSSREGAESTAAQGNTLLVFTVVTIIFLPLSFMASFFALAIAQFPKDHSGNTSWPLKYVSGLLFGISFGVSLPFIFLAFNIRWVTTPWNYLRHIGIKVLVIILLRPLRNSKSWFVKGHIWTIRLILSLTNYEFTSQLDRAWIMQVIRATRPAFIKKYYGEKSSDEEEYSGLDEDTDADTEDSWDEDMETKTALFKHLGEVYKKPRRRNLRSV
ncbi:hypothetical protein F5882DRAFT_510319 [Hyaloscypha sp. PMI_1271]|nr:hypothetical protein F5882DRAFT_510319 [Hyaloscypha sp. PMI_1271]